MKMFTTSTSIIHEELLHGGGKYMTLDRCIAENMSIQDNDENMLNVRQVYGKLARNRQGSGRDTVYKI